MVLAGQRDAFRVLVERYQGRVYGMVAHLLRDKEAARDVTQEAFLDAFKGLGTYDRTRSFAPWLFTIAQRRAFATLRRRRAEMPDQETVARRAVVGTFADDLIKSHGERHMMHEILRFLDELDVKYRATVLLRHREGLSLAETAEALDVPVGTVKSRLHEAYRILRARVTEGGQP